MDWKTFLRIIFYVKHFVPKAGAAGVQNVVQFLISIRSVFLSVFCLDRGNIKSKHQNDFAFPDKLSSRQMLRQV